MKTDQERLNNLIDWICEETIEAPDEEILVDLRESWGSIKRFDQKISELLTKYRNRDEEGK